MYLWYSRAEICLVYLSDYDSTSGCAQPSLNKSCVESPDEGVALHLCRWFTRGWTLQELLAPRNIEFFDREWRLFGTRSSLASQLSTITKIPEVLLERKVAEGNYSVATRMSWAADRVTTRGEDTAYCLFGLFDVNLPLLYGEGAKRAFRRLQEAIIQSTNDLTIFVWQYSETNPPENVSKSCYRGFTERQGRREWPTEACSILAQSPKDFKNSGDIICYNITNNPEYSVTNKGVKFINWHCDRSGSNHAGGLTFDLRLNCRRSGHKGTDSLWITLRRLKEETWYRCKSENFQSHGTFWKRANQHGIHSRQRHFYVTTCPHG